MCCTTDEMKNESSNNVFNLIYHKHLKPKPGLDSRYNAVTNVSYQFV